MEISGGGVGLSLNQMLLSFTVAFSFAIFMSTIICVLSLSAKSGKEGQLRISLFTLIPIVIGGASIYLDNGSISLGIAFVPIINIINILKMIFLNVVKTKYLILTVMSTLVYGFLFLSVGYVFINSEGILSKPYTQIHKSSKNIIMN